MAEYGMMGGKMPKKKMKEKNMRQSMGGMTKPVAKDSYYHLSDKKRTRRSL